MSQSVTLPLWLFVLILLFAGVTFASHFLFPSVRWFFRRRAERLVAQLNTRLQRPIEPFKLMRRQDRIVRLIYDPAVLQAITEHAAQTNVPPSVAFQEARTYAREIVPGFSTTLYFGVAIRAAKWLTKLLYRVRIGRVDAELSGIDPQATVIFVMNHRSNMDYLLVTWLVADRSALSYAVGEWARVWPLSRLIRSLGAYFIRRSSRNALYRQVLARYVQMAAAEGTTQAIFPEGGLSLDGRVGSAKMGLLHYIVSGFDPAGCDVVFVPVGLAYDRVLEDRVLIRAAREGTRRFRAPPMAMARFLGRTLWQMLLGRFTRFGTAAAGFGPPLSLRAWLAASPTATVEGLGTDLMARITHSVPVLPVPLVAAVLAKGPISRDQLPHAVTAMTDLLRTKGVALRLTKDEDPMDAGLRPLVVRGLVVEQRGVLHVAAGAEQMISYYAAAVLQGIEA